jgi:hypothetical protein
MSPPRLVSPDTRGGAVCPKRATTLRCNRIVEAWGSLRDAPAASKILATLFYLQSAAKSIFSRLNASCTKTLFCSTATVRAGSPMVECTGYGPLEPRGLTRRVLVAITSFTEPTILQKKKKKKLRRESGAFLW